jgi:VCBS repeat protein
MKALRIVLAVASAMAATIVVGVSPANAQQFIMRDFGTDQGWQGDRHPRFVVDITGDGRADVVGFGETGVHTAVATSNGQYQASFQVSNDFGFNTGWRVGLHDRFVTDITGDGRADIVGVGDSAVYTAVSIGGGNFGTTTLVSNTFNSAACTIRKMADANGDGRSDLFCIRNQRIDVALANGNGGFGPPILVTTVFPVLDFQGFTTTFTIVDVTGDRRADILGTISSSQGSPPGFLTLTSVGDGTYNAEEIGGGIWPPSGGPVPPDQVADVSGDGFADLVYFNEFTWVARGRGDGTFASFIVGIQDFGRNAGWNPTTHPRFATDLNGDHRSDIIGFGNPGVFTAAGRTNGQFVAPVTFASVDFGRNQGWTDPVTFPRFVADITGDGLPDIVGFGIGGLYTAVNLGGTFS